MRTPDPSFGRRRTTDEVLVETRPRSRRTAIGLGLGLVVLIAALAVRYLDGALHSSPLAAAQPADTTIVPPDLTPLRAFPNTTITWYDVPGTDTRAIHDYMRAHGATDPHDQSVGEGWTQWHLKWRYPVTPAGCDTAAVQVRFSADVTLPRFVDFDRMDAAHQAGWDRYLNALIVHESGHIRHAYQHVDDVAAAMRGRNCGDVNAAAQAAVDTLGQYDAAYDQETHHGQTQGVRYPD